MSEQDKKKMPAKHIAIWAAAFAFLALMLWKSLQLSQKPNAYEAHALPFDFISNNLTLLVFGFIVLYLVLGRNISIIALVLAIIIGSSYTR